mmetsp:Transcript_5313/g.8147  ORF Transcript_5313/g.8147 Transcript_5313/m.8147 type:complete len:265 (+) Transcript_5313:72-866(+)
MDYIKLSRVECIIDYARKDEYRALKFMLKDHPELVNCMNEDMDSALHVACIHGNHRSVKILVHRHADIQQKNMFGKSPLHIACYKGYPKIVRYLMLSCRAQIAALDYRGNTPLHEVCVSPTPSSEILKLLLVCGADIHKLNDFRMSPVHVAEKISPHPEKILPIIKNYLPVETTSEERKRDRVLFSLGMGIAAGFAGAMKAVQDRQNAAVLPKAEECSTITRGHQRSGAVIVQDASEFRSNLEMLTKRRKRKDNSKKGSQIIPT